jgi:hypothetical protein
MLRRKGSDIENWLSNISSAKTRDSNYSVLAG